MDLRGIPGLPRGLANNNPANLRRSSSDWEGKVPFDQSTDNDFEQFYTLEYGLRAAGYNIYKILLDTDGTIHGLINTWAPPSDGNNTSAYVNFVSNETGLPADQQISLDADTLKKIVTAIGEQENGKQAFNANVPESSIIDGLNMLPPDIILQIGQFIKKNPGTIIAFFLQ